MVEQENEHFGKTIVRNFLHDAFNLLFYSKLSESKDETLAALAAKSLKEVKYHLRHTSNWLVRLGDGTEESNAKAQESLDDLWQFTAELFEMDKIDTELLNAGIGVDNSALKCEWDKIINTTLKKAKFVTNSSGTILLNNTNLPLGKILKENPVESFSQTQFVSIATTNRAFTLGDRIIQANGGINDEG